MHHNFKAEIQAFRSHHVLSFTRRLFKTWKQTSGST